MTYVDDACDLEGNPGRPERVRYRDMLKEFDAHPFEFVEVPDVPAPTLLKGAKVVRATSPEGARVAYEGKCLHVARQSVTGQHFTIHEVTVGYALVAIVPDTWAIEIERNQ